jgi:hypothetical protein
MDDGIWATWYDLPEAGRAGYFDWLHDTHLPMICAKPGIAWAAHYKITGGGEAMDAIHQRLARAQDDEVGTGTQFLVLVGAPSAHVFCDPRIDQWQDALGGQSAQMLALRQGSRTCIFTQEAFVTGPEYHARATGSTPGPAIQMGSFRTKTIDDEFDLAAWYAQYRLPHMSRMAGCIATRKLISIAGWAKHSVLYEFLSLEDRQRYFQNHESLALDDSEWTNKIITYTVHAPGSPSIAMRLWPPVETQK